jgi:hypothetical protein
VTGRVGRAVGGAARPSLLPVLTLACVLVAAGCEASDAGFPHGHVVVRDSAGVTIVENPAGAEEHAPRGTLDPVPLVEIGGGAEAEGPFQFTHVPGALALPDGRIVIQEIRTGEIRYFSPEGEHLVSAGGVGEGPGEFLLLSLPAFSMGGDTVGVWDLQARRLTTFHGDGSLAALHSMPDRSAFPLGAMGDGRLVAHASEVDPEGSGPNGLRRTRTTFLLGIPGSSADWDTVTTIRGGGSFGAPPSPDVPVGPLAIPFSPVPAAGTDGERLAVTDGARRELRIFDRTGTLTRIVRVAGGPEPLEESRFRAEVERRLMGVEDPAGRRARREVYERMPVPATVPAWTGSRVGGFSRLLLDPATEEIWVRHFHPVNDALLPTDEGPPSLWTVLARDGSVRGTVEVPGGFTPFQAVAGDLLGLARDELHLERVQLRRVVRP